MNYRDFEPIGCGRGVEPGSKRGPCNGGGGGGGGSESSSATTTTTTNTDKRQVVSDNGVGITSDASTVNVTMADQGTVLAAIDLSKLGANNQLAAYQSLLGTSAGLLDKLIDANDKNIDLANKAVQAYTPVDSGGTVQSKVNGMVEVAIALAVAAVAVKVWGK